MDITGASAAETGTMADECLLIRAGRNDFVHAAVKRLLGLRPLLVGAI